MKSKNILSKGICISVAQMWDGDGWKWHLLRQWLDESICLQIESVHLVSNSVVSDALIWKPFPSSQFSVRTAFKLASEEFVRLDNPKWTIIWKLEIFQRIRLFLWL